MTTECGRLRQKDPKFKASLVCILRPCFKKKKEQNKNGMLSNQKTPKCPRYNFKGTHINAIFKAMQTYLKH
jgi:hypothetical protein